jgi:hypothetical protein
MERGNRMSAGPECAVESCGAEPAADRWTVGIWSATAPLFACLYAYGEEGAYDAAGRWRRRQLRHHLAGAAADRVRALAMAAHFCSLVRQLARAHAKARGGTAHVRRSFEHGCADRLVARLHGEAAVRRCGQDGVAGEANAILLRAAGLVPRTCPPRPDRSADDRAAARHGRAAADNISLVLRTGAAAPLPAARKPPQLSMF